MHIFRLILAFFLDIIESIVVAAAIFVVIYLFFLQPHQVVGNSMLPNFHDKEFILTDKISYRFREPKRGEVVIFKSPDDKDKDFIKRIIGLPGDKVKLVDGKIYVNGTLLLEAYLSSDLHSPAGRFMQENQEVQVPNKSLFVLGDNRLNSSDSRTFGFISFEEVIGKALLVYWPPPQFGLVPEINYR